MNSEKFKRKQNLEKFNKELNSIKFKKKLHLRNERHCACRQAHLRETTVPFFGLRAHKCYLHTKAAPLTKAKALFVTYSARERQLATVCLLKVSAKSTFSDAFSEQTVFKFLN